MTIKLLDLTISVVVSEAEEKRFKEKLKEKYDVLDKQLLNNIELSEYMLYEMKISEEGFSITMFNPQTIKENLPNSKIYFCFRDVAKDKGMYIRSWRCDNE